MEKSLLLEENCVKTPSTLILHWNLRIAIARSSYYLTIYPDSTRFSNSFFSKNTDVSFFWRSHSLFFCFCCVIPKMLLLVHSVEFWVTRIDRKCCWCWHASKINLIFLQLYLLHFPFNMSIDSSSLKADSSFLKILKFVFYIGLGVLID